MQNRFTFKDSMLFLLIGVVGLLAFLSMQAGDRLWREMQKLESKMSDIERSGGSGSTAGIDDLRQELAALKTAIASRPINVHVTGVAASGTAAPAPVAEAPVAGSYRVDGELASFFTAKDESFMIERTLSRLQEMTG